MVISQYAVHRINLDPTLGSEVSKTRPCIIISPNEMNQYLKTVIIAPLTHTIKSYPSRVTCKVDGDDGSIMLDQLRTVDKARIGNFIATLNPKEILEIKAVLNEMLC
jgi:mRNA interferase MazF